MQLACRWTFGKIRFRVKRDGLATGYPSSSEGCERRSQRLRSGKLFFHLRNRLKSLTGKNTTSAELPRRPWETSMAHKEPDGRIYWSFARGPLSAVIPKATLDGVGTSFPI